MKKISIISYVPYAALSLLAVICTIPILTSGNNYFLRFIGPVHPLLMVFLIALVGTICLYYLNTRVGIRILHVSSIGKALTAAAAGAIVFLIPVISVDLVLRYGENINIPPPAAFFFYPAIGFIAETVFHLLPLTISLFFIKQRRKRNVRTGIPVPALIPAVLAEPVFQLAFSGDFLAATSIFTFFHVLLISIYQIHLLGKFDYLSMFTFRMVYYLLWHILWGVLRLKLLF